MFKQLLILITVLSTTSWFVKADNFEVGVENIEYLPFSNVNNNQYSGFYREIFDRFSQDNHHTFTYRLLPIKRLTGEFLAGSIDFKIPDNEVWAQNLKKDKAISYSLPLTTYIDGIVVKPVNKGKPYSELTSIVTVLGFTPFPFLDDIAKGNLKVNETNSFESVVKLVDSGRAKGGFVNITVAKYYMETVLKQPDMLVFDPSLPKGVSEISLSSIKHPQIIAEFNQWLVANETWLKQLKQKYKVD